MICIKVEFLSLLLSSYLALLNLLFSGNTVIEKLLISSEFIYLPYPPPMNMM